MRTDRNRLRFNQILLVLLLPLAFFLKAPWLVGMVFLLMISQHTGFDLLVFLKNLLRIPPHFVEEDPRPHWFARSLGALFSGLVLLAFFLGWEALGWSLALLVAFLALINLVFGFCLGCFLYLQLRYVRYFLTRR